MVRRPASRRFEGYELWETQTMARRASDRPLYSKLAGPYTMQTELKYILQDSGNVDYST